MRHIHLVPTSLALLGALALSACTANGATVPSSTPASTDASSAEQACVDFGDVQTIAANADAGLSTGRMEVQEQEGWYRLATRVLDRVPSANDSAVSDALVALKEIAPAVTPGAMQTADIGSAEWNSGVHQLSTACAELGVELTISMFTGG